MIRSEGSAFSSTPVKTVTPITTLIKATTSPVTKVSPVAQALTVKTTTVAPTALKSAIPVTPTVKTNDTLATIGQFALGALGLPGVAGIIYQGVTSAFPSVTQVSTGAPASIASKPIDITQSQYYPAIVAASNEKQGANILANPNVQKTMAAIRTGVTMGAIENALPNYSQWLSANVLPVVYNKELGDVSKIATAKQNLVNTVTSPLAQGTFQGEVYKSQVANTTTVYERLVERYNEIIREGTGGTNNAPAATGTNWGNIALIGIAVIGVVILLGAFIKR
jgi:hypothetical protein